MGCDTRPNEFIFLIWIYIYTKPVIKHRRNFPYTEKSDLGEIISYIHRAWLKLSINDCLSMNRLLSFKTERKVFTILPFLRLIYDILLEDLQRIKNKIFHFFPNPWNTVPKMSPYCCDLIFCHGKSSLMLGCLMK